MNSAARAQRKLIARLLEVYTSNRELIGVFMQSVETAVTESSALRPHIHSVRSRLKDPDHLRDKLLRKMNESQANGEEFDITPENLLQRINDLAGVRILHLHTTQIGKIDPIIRGILEEQRFTLIEGPFARTWDDEYRTYFEGVGVTAQASPSLYTSVHYVIGSASKTAITCELQVRTLMEEVWGEVDHTLNYPHKTPSVGCREQLRALARVTSSATRLVDSIFATWSDYVDSAQRAAAASRSIGPTTRRVRQKSMRRSRG